MQVAKGKGMRHGGQEGGKQAAHAVSAARTARRERAQTRLSAATSARRPETQGQGTSTVCLRNATQRN